MSQEPILDKKKIIKKKSSKYKRNYLMVDTLPHDFT